ncbi:MAG: hypothetical protein ACI8PZ_004032 [Myxococcota bacterium]
MLWVRVAFTLPLIAIASACEPGGLAVRVPLLDAQSSLEIIGVVDETTYSEVVLTNVGSGRAEVTVAITAPFAIDTTRFEIAEGEASGALVSWRPTGFNDAHGLAIVASGSDRLEVLLLGIVLEDADGDGHRDQRAGGDDCDDSDPGVNPDASDACGDGVDMDCDGTDPICDH